MIFKVFNKEIDVPLDEKTLIITGFNDSFKLNLIRAIKDYYVSQDKNILYFPEDRKMTISKEIIENVDIMRALRGIGPLKESLSKCFDLDDPFAFEDLKYGQNINCGYLQMLNLFYNITLTQPDTIIIERAELNYHIMLFNCIIRSLIATTNIINIIITTYDEKIFHDHFKQYAFNIDKYL